MNTDEERCPENGYCNGSGGTEDCPIHGSQTHAHHDGLPDGQLRDFVARTERTGTYVNVGIYGSPGTREGLVAALEEARANLEQYDLGCALATILAKFGYELHDVSGYVDYDRKTYRHFVGTREEAIARYPQLAERSAAP